jgi:cyclopropane-fatty-acyl-phospholipid synthase
MGIKGPTEIGKHPQNPSLIDRGAEMALRYVLSNAGLKMGTSPSADIKVNDPAFYRHVLMEGTMGLGNSYMDGEWDSAAIDEVVVRILQSGVYQKLAPIYGISTEIRRRTKNLQDRTGARQVVEQHYDLPVEFYQAFLDPYNQYTCARFEGTENLDEAQRLKMDNICQKLNLKAGDRVLDVGGGWGGLAQYMQENYGVKVTVVTLSGQQAEHIRKTYGGEIEVFEGDYRDLPDSFKGSFDAVSAVGVLEHIGCQNYPEFMKTLNGCLKVDGRILMHTLFTPDSSPAQNPWVDKHIFPNGELPPAEVVTKEMQRYFEPIQDSKFETFEELTPNYPPTLHAWKNNLTASRDSGKIQMSDREFRKWEFYFMLYAGAIKAKYVRVGQFLYEKK